MPPKKKAKLTATPVKVTIQPSLFSFFNSPGVAPAPPAVQPSITTFLRPSVLSNKSKPQIAKKSDAKGKGKERLICLEESDVEEVDSDIEIIEEVKIVIPPRATTNEHLQTTPHVTSGRLKAAPITTTITLPSLRESSPVFPPSAQPTTETSVISTSEPLHSGNAPPSPPPVRNRMELVSNEAEGFFDAWPDSGDEEERKISVLEAEQPLAGEEMVGSEPEEEADDEVEDDRKSDGYKDVGENEWEDDTMMSVLDVSLDLEIDEGQQEDDILTEEVDDVHEVQQGCSKDLEENTVCPLCQKSLVLFSLDKRRFHLNSCLDSTSNIAPRNLEPNPKEEANTTFTSLYNTFSTSTPHRPAPVSIPRTAMPPVSKVIPPTPIIPNSKPKIAPRPLSSLPRFALPSAPPSSVSAPNAFNTLMTSHAESKLWAIADSHDPMRGGMPKGVKRVVPFYKILEGMPEISVDAFRYNSIDKCKAYFLSHAHSDHYQNMNSSWRWGPIYASLTTINLIRLKLKVKDEYLKVLPMNQTVKIPGTKCFVTLIDANHCPGSTIFLFEGPQTDPKSVWSKSPKIFRYLHCGDFRASPEHINHPAMIGKKIDICYLDTTYLNPTYCFPAQELVIEACSELVRCRILDGDQGALFRNGGEGQVKSEKLMKGWLGKVKDEPEIKGEVKGEIKDEVEGEDPPMESEESKDGATAGTLKEEVKDEIDLKGKRKAEDQDAPDAPDDDKKSKEKMLVLVGTYSIGKERIVKAIAIALKTKIYCDDHKLALFKAQDDPLLHSLITREPLEAQVHVVTLRDINHDALSTYLAKYRNEPNKFTKVIGLRPTGWTHKAEPGQQKVPTIAQVLEREGKRQLSPAGMYPQKDSTPNCMAFGVPYSEHSSFFELTCFALSLDYVRMIATVNIGSQASRAKMALWFEKWKMEKKRRKDAGLSPLVPRSKSYW